MFTSRKLGAIKRSKNDEYEYESERNDGNKVALSTADYALVNL